MNNRQRAGSAIVIAAASLLAFIKPWEGSSLPVYADQLAGGLPTVCNGHTGADVRLGDVWTKEQCDAVLVKDVEGHGSGVLACVPVAINQHEYEAYASLAYNLGVGAVCGSSIPGKLARGENKQACNTIREFNKVRDRTKPKVWNAKRQRYEYPLIAIRGLTNRRNAEAERCLQPMDTTAKEVA